MGFSGVSDITFTTRDPMSLPVTDLAEISMMSRCLDKLTMGPPTRLYASGCLKGLGIVILLSFLVVLPVEGYQKVSYFLGADLRMSDFGEEKRCKDEELIFVKICVKNIGFESSRGVIRSVWCFHRKRQDS